MELTEEKLKEILVEPGHIDVNDFERATTIAKEKSEPLDRILVKEGFIDDANFGKIIADTEGYSFFELKKANIEEISDHLLSYIPEAVARSQEAIIFKEEEGVLFLATTNPDNYKFIKHLEKITGSKINVYYTTSFAIDMALRRYSGNLQREARKLIEKTKKDEMQEEQVVVKLVELLFEHAYANIASDIHIEPLADFSIVRFRIDGTLFKVLDFPKRMHNRMASRIKILSKLRSLLLTFLS